MKYSFDQSVIVAMLMALLLMGLGYLSLVGIGNLVETAHWVEHTQIVIDRLQTLLTEVEEESLAVRSFLLTNDPAYLQAFREARQAEPAQFQAVKELTSDNPTRQEDCVKLLELLNVHSVIAERLGQPSDHLTLTSRAQQIGESNKAIDEIKAQIVSMQADERRLLQQRTIQTQQSSALVKSIIITGLFIGLTVLLVNSLYLQHVRKMRGRAEETLRQNEERMRLMIESVKDYAIFMLDPTGRVMSWNSGVERLKGYRAEEIIGQHFSRFYPEEKIRAGLPERGLLEAAEKGRFEDEGWRVRKDGSRFWADVVINAVHNTSGELIGFVKLTRDVTNRKEADERIQKLNEELKQRADLLESANKELEAFSYSVSHDLRAPLRHIHGFVELLQKSPALQGEESSRRQMGIISKAAREMGRLIDDLLDFSRTGRVEMHPVKINLREMIDQIIQDREMECQGRRVTWVIKPLSMVAGDPGLLRLVWVNLIDNALKYSRSRPEAKIEIGQNADSGNNSDRHEEVFYIRDNGVGFDMRYASKLFGVFQRLHRSEDFEGTGIGLANVQRIIHRHGGRVWAEGEVGSGATFYFSLPITTTQTVQSHV
jgi:PAS domain S-box-containing protein